MAGIAAQTGRKLLAASLPVLLCLLLCITTTTRSAAADPAPVGASSAGSTSTAEAQKSAADAQVAALTAKIVAARGRVAAANGAAEVAEQRYTRQMELQQTAADAAAAAEQQRRTAQQTVEEKHAQVVSMVITAYESGNNVPGSSVAAMISAPDLETLLDQTGLKQQLSAEQANVLTQFGLALAAVTTAEQAAKDALQRQRAATTAAEQAVAAARAASAKARAEQASLNQALSAAKSVQAAAAEALAAEQAAVPAFTAAQARALQVQYANQVASAQSVPIAPNTGRWTPAAGQTAVNRALRWLGTPYSWAGGGISGPTLGVAVDADSANDGSIVGFDCSGLMMYAWGPYISLTHNAAEQYVEAGSLHPSVADLMPGDLVFWSPAGGAGNISHVAIYLGGGNVVQAPHSGDVIKITPMNAVDYGYFGATRPLT
ncbi:cell wall-associated NlpC family hydrolase [Jatrophihabitans sp. GAS493]|uniref:C40 family peptidase n=1 Tax=Jatrophihabitans sp. GAS493 TaxID=1907575 RepID=UPI000BB6CE7D|nr:C40 family peptidase [Jatrophihabitans sp. GAS493]SOD74520.1 cell wall-associated NlpC family hydrolase [Jatrophihabitans sp. GAS493]